MIRSKRIGSELAAAAIGAAVLFLLAFAPASAAGTTAANPASPGMDAASGCPSAEALEFLAPESPGFLSLEGGACKAEAPAESSFSAKPQRPRYCRCSCGGLQCTSDADCGGALGSCRVGITCC
jgi:hypothetical protein